MDENKTREFIKNLKDNPDLAVEYLIGRKLFLYEKLILNIQLKFHKNEPLYIIRKAWGKIRKDYVNEHITKDL